jgi:hypothetical protein
MGTAPVYLFSSNAVGPMIIRFLRALLARTKKQSLQRRLQVILCSAFFECFEASSSKYSLQGKPIGKLQHHCILSDLVNYHDNKFQADVKSKMLTSIDYAMVLKLNLYCSCQQWSNSPPIFCFPLVFPSRAGTHTGGRSGLPASVLVSSLDVRGSEPRHLNLEYPVSKPSLAASLANDGRRAGVRSLLWKEQPP